MGYDTRFEGQFNISPTLAMKDYHNILLIGYEPGAPSDCCDWEPTMNGNAIKHNGAEKSYHYQEWVQYIVTWLAARGYKVFGEVKYNGEDHDDFGKLVVVDGVVKKYIGKRVYTYEEAK